MNAAEEFTAFFTEFERALWQALVPLGGPELATEAAADALADAWARWDHVGGMENRRGYVYVAAKRLVLRRRDRPQAVFPAPAADELVDFEPGLIEALKDLSEMQRTMVFLVVACHWRATEVAELLGVSESAVRTHESRGMAQLRKRMKVGSDVES